MQFSQLWTVACMDLVFCCIFVSAPFRIELDDNYFPGIVCKTAWKTTKPPANMCCMRTSKEMKTTRTPHAHFIWWVKTERISNKKKKSCPYTNLIHNLIHTFISCSHGFDCHFKASLKSANKQHEQSFASNECND